MEMHKRPKYPRKPSPTTGRPREGKAALPEPPAAPASTKSGTPAPSMTLERLVAKLKGEGYAPVSWVVHHKGVRATSTGEGKVAIPSSYTKSRVCLKHGNLVKVRQVTSPDREDRGLRILDVLPCPFCTPNPVQAILSSPKTR